MVYTETVVVDGQQFTFTRSDGFMIRKIGTDELYSEAYDVVPCEYEEADISLPDDSDPQEDKDAALRILGVDVDG